MFLLMTVLSALAAPASTCDTSFVFVGPPSCVELTYADGRTQLTNGCDVTLLVDQSVQGTFEPVPPGSSAELRDLQAFTLGLDGKLYRAVALVEEVCEPADTLEESAGQQVAQNRR